MKNNKKPNINRQKSNNTEISHRPQHQRQYSLQSKLQRNKFALEYAKLTRDFQHILNKNSKRRLYSEGKVGPGADDPASRDGQRAGIQREGRNPATDGKLNINSNLRLASLFSNRLHYEILETASKLQTRRSSQTKHTKSYSYSRKTQAINTSQRSRIATHNVSTDCQMLVNFQREKEAKINMQFTHFEQMIAHFHNLYKIREIIEDYKSNYTGMIKLIKRYIMNHNGANINKLDNLLKIDREKEKLRVLLCIEKICVLGVLDSMARESELVVTSEGRVILDTVLGVYYSVFSYVLAERLYKNVGKQLNDDLWIRESLQACLNVMDAHGISKKKDLQSTSEYLLKKLQNLFKYNLGLLHRIKDKFVTITRKAMPIVAQRTASPRSQRSSTLVNSSEVSSKININRFFYHLLYEYARNLNCAQSLSILRTHKSLLDFFVTCPSPHLTYAPQHKLTLVLQFESALALVKVNSAPFSTDSDLMNHEKKQQNILKNRNKLYPNPNPTHNPNSYNKEVIIKLRPYAHFLVSELSKVCEIVLMTTLMPENIPKTISSARIKEKQQYEQFMQACSATLFRYHFVRYQGLLVKDINRLGRKIEHIIVVDSVEDGLNQANRKKEQQIGKQSIPGVQNLHLLTNKLHIDNIIPVSIWKGSPRDQQLLHVKNLVERVVEANQEDVRVALARLHRQARSSTGQTIEETQLNITEGELEKYQNTEINIRDSNNNQNQSVKQIAQN